VEIYDIASSTNTATFYYVVRDIERENELNKNRDIAHHAQCSRYYEYVIESEG